MVVWYLCEKGIWWRSKCIMKWLVIVLVVLVVFIIVLIVGFMILGDMGYVFIFLGNKVIEMIIISFGIIIICLLVGWYFLWCVIFWVISLLIGLYKWFGVLGECKCKCVFYIGF